MAPHKIKNMVPKHIWNLVERYGLHPESTEQSKSSDLH
jgi:hypothetical protein